MSEPERRITAIERQRRNPERVNLFLDGAFAMGLPLTAVTEAGLRVGLTLTPLEIESLQEMNDVARATDTAIRLLTSRPRAVAEIRDHLRRSRYDDETIAEVLRKLRDWNYFDDEVFARQWVENRERHRPRGRRLLELELRRKGVDREAADAAIEEAEVDEFRGALAIARDKLRTYGALEPAVAQRRLAGFLGRRGYGYDVIKPVLAELFGGVEDDGG
jgi:regulatory protein